MCPRTLHWVFIALTLVARINSLPLSNTCAASITSPSGCSPLGAALTTSLNSCTESGQCLTNLPSIIGKLRRNALTFSPVTCPLCSALDPASCTAAINAALSTPACSSSSDTLALSVLREQSRVVCARNSTTTQRAGAVSLLPLTQCSICGIMPCPPGLLCAPNTPPSLCPAGYACPPGASAAVPCVEGTFCPKGDASSPLACRSSAAGSCGPKASREVVWVPLLVSILVTLLVAAGQWWERVVRESRMKDPSAPLLSTTPPSSAPLSLSAPLDGGGGDGGGGGGGGLRVSFTSLSLVTKGVTRLDNLSGYLASGGLTAIMGGSGAGKTTLVNALLGKETPTSGTVVATLSHSQSLPPLTPTQLRLVLGLVPQTDVLLPELTVFEVILHSARTRNPPGSPTTLIAQRALVALGLEHVMHTLTPSLSASEKKRASIATELAASPQLLVCDEPTTGLDASGALRIMKSLTLLPLTVVAVLHQPRPEIWALVQELILLSRGGRPVYFGPRELAGEYVTSVLAYQQPSQTATADFVMDVINGVHGLPPCRGGGGKQVDITTTATTSAATLPPVGAVGEEGGGDETSIATSVAIAEILAEVWRTEGVAWVEARRKGVVHKGGAPSTPTSYPTTAGAATAATTLSVSSTPSRPGFLSQVALAAQRRVVQSVRSPALLPTLCSFTLGGAVAGLVMAGGPLFAPPAPSQYFNSCPPDAPTDSQCNRPRELVYQPAPFYIAMILGSLAITPAVRSFGSERLHSWREAGVGGARRAYFLGVLCVDALLWVLYTLCFWGPIMAIAPLRGPEGPFFAVFLSICAVCSSIGYALSGILGEGVDQATLIGVVGAVTMNLFGGFVPMIGTYGGWAYTHWAQRALVGVELLEGYGLTAATYNTLVPSEWRTPNWPADIGYMWLITALTCFLALLCTLVFHAEKAR